MPANPNSGNWQMLLDLSRRQGVSGVQVSDQDAVNITKMVSNRMYSRHPWQFTLNTTPKGTIPCQTGQQDYAAPSDCYRLVKAWIFVPVVNNGISPSNVPPPDDPSYAAYLAALESQIFVGTNNPVPYAPQVRNLTLVKNIQVNLNCYSWVSIDTITQMGNSMAWRLKSAVYVPDSQPFEIQAQYQPLAAPIEDMGVTPWFPDEYNDMAVAGFLYYLYQFANDPRAGTATYLPDNRVEYTGQLGTWIAQINAAAMEEQAGTVDNFVPQDSLGVDYRDSGDTWWC